MLELPTTWVGLVGSLLENDFWQVMFAIWITIVVIRIES